jgi:hypothetical protein
MNEKKLLFAAEMAAVLWIAWSGGLALAALAWGLWVFARWLWRDGPNARAFKLLVLGIVLFW